MIITGIRHKIRSEIDERRSASFTRYLMHYLRMFAFLGVIVPGLIGVDYALKQKTKEDTVVNKFSKITGSINGVEYHLYTNKYHFISDVAFFDHINKGDRVTYYYTPIFKTITDASYTLGETVYSCKPVSIYGWPVIVAGLTLLCSTILLIGTRDARQNLKRHHSLKSDSMVNLGVVNAFLCLFVLVSILFHFPY